MEERFYKFSLFSNFPELVHGISNRNYGDIRFGNILEADVIKNRQQFFRDLGISVQNVVTANQVHGDKVVIVGESEMGRGANDGLSAIPETDGLISTEKGVFLMVQTADCLPVLIYDPVNEIVAAVHVGWRGILNQIILRMIDKLTNLGSSAEDLIVGIGPAICQKHFIVKDSVLKQFLQEFPSATFVRNKDGYVDLKKAAMVELKKANVPAGNIETSKLCTVCDNGIYGSFRKEGSGAPEFASIIGIRK